MLFLSATADILPACHGPTTTTSQQSLNHCSLSASIKRARLFVKPSGNYPHRCVQQCIIFCTEFHFCDCFCFRGSRRFQVPRSSPCLLMYSVYLSFSFISFHLFCIFFCVLLSKESLLNIVFCSWSWSTVVQSQSPLANSSTSCLSRLSYSVHRWIILLAEWLRFSL